MKQECSAPPRWSSRLPRLAAIGEEAVEFAEASERTTVTIDDSFDGWDLLCVIEAAGQKLAVLEWIDDTDAALAYVGTEGVALLLPKTVANLEQIPSHDEVPVFDEGYYQRIQESGPDVLGEEVLAGGEPGHDRVAALLPPLISYTFVGHRDCAEKVVVAPDGAVLGFFDNSRVAFGPQPQSPPRELVLSTRRWQHGLLGECYPIVEIGWWDDGADCGQEQVVFCSKGSDGQLQVWMRLRDQQSASGASERRHFLLPAAEPHPDPTAFYAALYQTALESREFLDALATIEVPEEKVNTANAACLLRAWLTYVGDDPRYGILVYARDEHRGFPPTTLSFVECLADWGALALAKRLLDRYRDDYVRDDGSFCYYGPAVSEYGQMLALIVRCWELSDDDDWLAGWLPKARAIAELLRAKWLAAREAFAPDHPCHGVIHGLPEADFTSTNTVGHYYSGAAWAWRGFVSLGRALQRLGETAEAQRLLADAVEMKNDIVASVRRTLRQDIEPPFIPDLAERTRPYKHLTEDRDAYYANYRYYPELLSAGLLDEETAMLIREFRRQRGGECLGTTRIAERLDDWPASHWAWALMELGLRDQYLLLFYGHLAHHLSKGTYSAYEQVQIDPASRRGSLFRRSFALGEKPVRMEVADHCIPAQLTTPRMTRWALVWEERDGDVLWLCRGAPRAWFESGKSIRVEGVPTRWGPVSMHVTSEGGCEVHLALPESGLPAEIVLCIPPLSGHCISGAKVNGRPVADSDLDGDRLRLPAGLAGDIVVEIR